MGDVWLTIGEVARRSGLATSALRFYEAEGLVRATRSGGGQRRFHRETLRRIAFVRIAQRVGLSLDEVREALATLPASRTPTKEDWARLSRSWKPRLDAQIATLERLRDRLTSCIGCGCLSLQACALYNPEDAAARLGAGPRYLLGDAPEDVRDPVPSAPRGHHRRHGAPWSPASSR
ncbi:MAG TPA: redox-sensitive transcriptional activator SoxR [Candidatus Binatia bacterium]|nr:redox-sensitive transcriptional activator SoxR [Candidatus Binatia bacterium]